MLPQASKHGRWLLNEFFIYCVVLENIHTPTMEGIGNSEGEGVGGQRPRKFQREGGLHDQFSFQRYFDSIQVRVSTK